MLVLVLLAFSAQGFLETKRAVCQRKLLCNGILCTTVCESGSVDVDPWIIGSLNYQRKLQLDQPFMKFELPGTHNSAISQAYGFGIEEDGIEALLGINLYKGDDEGEGVCQYLSLTDQLRIGLRHIEIDIWWGGYIGHTDDIIVCHSPIPGYPVWEVEEAAKKRNLTLNWDVRKLSCLDQYRNFSDILQEVKTWMDANPDQFVVLYLDTKFPPTPHQAARGNQDMLNVFGSQIFLPSEGDPRLLTVRQLMDMGKRVIFEDHENGWLHPAQGPAVVFTPDLWDHQFGASDFQQYPNCSIEGDADWYGKKMVRALDGSFPEAATRCAVNVVAGNYQNPDSMQFFVWSWDVNEPRVPGGCPAMLPTSKWAALDCQLRLRAACVSTTNELDWVVSLSSGPFAEAGASCPAGYKAAAPTNGYVNARLRDAVVAEVVWLTVPPTLMP